MAEQEKKGYKKYTGKEYFMNAKDVETQTFPWGTLEWLDEPRTTGTDNMTSGIVTLKPGSGHSEHNHTVDEVLYAIDGQDCEQYIILEDGTRVAEIMQPGDVVHIPKNLMHGTINRGPVDFHMFAVYETPGSEAELGALPECTIVPPEE